MPNTNNESAKKSPSRKAGKAKGAKALNDAAMARAIASASKRIPAISLDAARLAYAGTSIRDEGACTVYAMKMNERFAKALADHRVHWSDIWTSKNAKADGSNYQPLWRAIEGEHQELLGLLKGKHSNPAQVWKRVRDKAYAIACPNQKRERDHVVPSQRAERALKSLYKMLMRETMPSELDLKASEEIGRMLIALFKVDLSTLDV